MKYYYFCPEMQEIVLNSITLICDSPAPGANEQVTIEDWSDLINNE